MSLSLFSMKHFKYSDKIRYILLFAIIMPYFFDQKNLDFFFILPSLNPYSSLVLGRYLKIKTPQSNMGIGIIQL